MFPVNYETVKVMMVAREREAHRHSIDRRADRSRSMSMGGVPCHLARMLRRMVG
jgi:hypothetical protein